MSHASLHFAGLSLKLELECYTTSLSLGRNSFSKGFPWGFAHGKSLGKAVPALTSSGGILHSGMWEVGGFRSPCLAESIRQDNTLGNITTGAVTDLQLNKKT